MRRAIAEAAVGDEQKREDPSVNALQERVAALLGQEAAIFLPTATMANQIALKLHSRPGDVLIAEEHSHVVIYEYGGAAAHAGLMTIALPGARGRVTPEQVRDAAEPSTKVADQRAVLLSLEDTHNSSGGRVWPLDELDEVVGAARDVGLAAHLDGARLLNASVALGVAPSEIAARFDTVTLCLSKGLGCPLGALLAGSRELMERAWREKHLFGGAMRQAGIVAAAGVYALDHHVERLAEDHARARSLAEALHEAGVPGRPRSGRDELRPDRRGAARASHASEALARLQQAGVGLSATIHPTVMRAVTHLDVDGRRTSRRRRGSCPRRCWPASRRSQRTRAAGCATRPLGYQRRSFVPLRRSNGAARRTPFAFVSCGFATAVQLEPDQSLDDVALRARCPGAPAPRAAPASRARELRQRQHRGRPRRLRPDRRSSRARSASGRGRARRGRGSG